MSAKLVTKYALVIFDKTAHSVYIEKTHHGVLADIQGRNIVHATPNLCPASTACKWCDEVASILNYNADPRQGK